MVFLSPHPSSPSRTECPLSLEAFRCTSKALGSRAQPVKGTPCLCSVFGCFLESSRHEPVINLRVSTKMRNHLQSFDAKLIVHVYSVGTSTEHHWAEGFLRHYGCLPKNYGCLPVFPTSIDGNIVGLSDVPAIDLIV